MRTTASSRTAWAISSLGARAVAALVPNGFSITIRLPAERPMSASARAVSENSVLGRARWKAAGPASCLPGAGERPGLGHVAAPVDQPATQVPANVRGASTACSSRCDRAR